MEKILSDSEKIRRAEEIYAKRRGIQIDNIEENEKGFNIYKTCFKLLLLLNIILIVLLIQNKENIFKEEFIGEISVYSESINQKVNSFLEFFKEESKSNIVPSETTTSDTTEEIKEKEAVENTVQSTNNEAKVEKTNEIVKEQTILEKIKSSYSFIKPVEGTVTSFFGDRESKYQNVTGYHKGIDIGAVSGTKIKSSIEGKVIQVSSKGDYR